jgi:hypothetical protein
VSIPQSYHFYCSHLNDFSFFVCIRLPPAVNTYLENLRLYLYLLANLFSQ